MLNPFKIKTKTISTGFSFAEIATIKCLVQGMRLEDCTFEVKITGKVKNANAYIINVLSLNTFYPAEQYDIRRYCLKSLKKNMDTRLDRLS